MTPLHLTATFLAIVFVGYMVITDRMVGTSYSISDSWYSWQRKGYSAAFIIFLACIASGLFFITHYYVPEHEAAFNLLLIGGGFSCYCIGIAANFKQGWRESLYHNIFSIATFLSVHMAFFIEGVTFPLYTFLMLSVVFTLIDIPKRTTVIEVCGIALAILGIYFL